MKRGEQRKGGRTSRKPGRAALSLTKWSPLIFTGQHANLCFVCIYSILSKYFLKRQTTHTVLSLPKFTRKHDTPEVIVTDFQRKL